jgi:hypothetical protein
MKVKGSRRLVARLGLALAVAAVAVPSASAMTMNATYEGGGGYGVRLYADDLHSPLPVATLKASNVRSDAASPQSPVPGSNVQTDAASFQPAPLPVAFAASNVRTDSTSYQPVSLLASNVRTDAASARPSVPITDARHAALFRKPHFAPPPSVSAAPSSGIDWSVAGFGAALGALGLMLLVSVVLFAGRHNRRGRLAAT